MTKKTDRPEALADLSDQDTAALFLGRMSARTLERWRLEGRGPKFVKLGKRVFYRREDLEAFVVSGLRHSTRDSKPAAA